MKVVLLILLFTPILCFGKPTLKQRIDCAEISENEEENNACIARLLDTSSPSPSGTPSGTAPSAATLRDCANMLASLSSATDRAQVSYHKGELLRTCISNEGLTRMEVEEAANRRNNQLGNKPRCKRYLDQVGRSEFDRDLHALCVTDEGGLTPKEQTDLRTAAANNQQVIDDSTETNLECKHLVEEAVDNDLKMYLAIAPQEGSNQQSSGIKFSSSPVRTPGQPPDEPAQMYMVEGLRISGQNLLNSAFKCAKMALGLRIIHDKFTNVSEKKYSGEEGSCTSYGEITKDYEDCKKLMAWERNFENGRMAVETAQVTEKQINDQQLQSKAYEQEQLGSNMTSSLEAIRGSVDKSAQHQHQRAALSAAEFATLQAKVRAFPTREKAYHLCLEPTSKIANELKDAVKTALGITENLTAADENPEQTPCDVAVSASGRYLFANQEVLNRIKGRMFEAGVRAGTELAQAELLDRQGDDMKKSIEELKERAEQQGQGGFDPDMMVSACQVNPGLPGCQQPGDQSEKILPGGFSFQGSGNSAGLTPQEREGNSFQAAAPGSDWNVGGGPSGGGMGDLERKLSRSVRGQGARGQRPGLAGGRWWRRRGRPCRWGRWRRRGQRWSLRSGFQEWPQAFCARQRCDGKLRRVWAAVWRWPGPAGKR